jgi:hypothetical protein
LPSLSSCTRQATSHIWPIDCFWRSRVNGSRSLIVMPPQIDSHPGSPWQLITTLWR